jgi:hydroxymethylbilane synthase
MSNGTSLTLRLGTRGSMLARAQSRHVADLLERKHPTLRVELVIFATSGDKIADRPLQELGGKGLFTKELEQALLAGLIDFAVHSFKDVPVTMPLVDQAELIIAAVPEREDPRDVLISPGSQSISELPGGARVGTGSLRRRCQLLDRRPDLIVEPIRGNIDTRLRKQAAGEFDAVVLALAGLKRAGLYDSHRMPVIELSDLLPAAGQGALALQCRRNDQRTRELLAALNDGVSATCVAAERELVKLLEGDCHSPIAALAEVEEGVMSLGAVVGARDGEPPVLRASARSERADAPLALAGEVFRLLTEQRVYEHLHGGVKRGG